MDVLQLRNQAPFFRHVIQHFWPLKVSENTADTIEDPRSACRSIETDIEEDGLFDCVDDWSYIDTYFDMFVCVGSWETKFG